MIPNCSKNVCVMMQISERTDQSALSGGNVCLYGDDLSAGQLLT
jgi:hypothetical protein